MSIVTIKQRQFTGLYQAKYLSYLAVIALCFLLIGCAPTEAKPTEAPSGSCALSIAQDAPDEEKITLVLRSEGEFVVKQQIDSLMALWAEGSSVVDAQHTATDDSDDQLWKGKDAIRHRYVRVVFPGAPDSITPSDLQIQLDADTASVVASTHIGNENSKAGDRWQLLRQNGCWSIQSLTYNLEAAQ